MIDMNLGWTEATHMMDWDRQADWQKYQDGKAKVIVASALVLVIAFILGFCWYFTH